jgi:hypothetical protein
MVAIRHYVVGEGLGEDGGTVIVGPYLGRRLAERTIAGKGATARSHPELVAGGQVETAAELRLEGRLPKGPRKADDEGK